jgi:hypothetical protein
MCSPTWQELVLYLHLMIPADEADLAAMEDADLNTLIGILGTLHTIAIAVSNKTEAA